MAQYGNMSPQAVREHLSRPIESDLTGLCPIREHTGDGAYVGRCDFATHDWVCPRHGFVSDYSTLDDRDVEIASRRFPPPRDPGKIEWQPWGTKKRTLVVLSLFVMVFAVAAIMVPNGWPFVVLMLVALCAALGVATSDEEA